MCNLLFRLFIRNNFVNSNAPLSGVLSTHKYFIVFMRSASFLSGYRNRDPIMETDTDGPFSSCPMSLSR
jgi:hypothetical protein